MSIPDAARPKRVGLSSGFLRIVGSRGISGFLAACSLVLVGATPATSSAERPGPAVADAPRVLTVRPGASGPLAFPRLADALAASRAGDEIRLAAGEYREGVVIRADRTRLYAEPGAVLRGVAAEGKAAIVVKANDVTISGLECADIAVPDGNGACVRLEGRDLLLSRVYFHDSEQGVLTGGTPGTVVIEDATFVRLGRGGQAHGIYIGGGRLEVRRSRFLASRDEGHEIKSRARETLIQDSIVASLDGDSSRAIDLPNGGTVLIERSLIAHGPNAMNRDLVSFGVEGNVHPGSQLTLRGNLILLERAGGNVLVHAAPDLPAPRITGNVIVGRGQAARYGDCNRVYESRADARLPPAPLLPERPSAASGGLPPAPAGVRPAGDC